VVVDHYSKWPEAKVVADHGVAAAASFLSQRSYVGLGFSSMC